MAKSKNTGFLAALGRSVDKAVYETHHLLRTGHFSHVGSFEKSFNDGNTDFRSMEPITAKQQTAPGQAIEEKKPFNIWSYLKEQNAKHSEKDQAHRTSFDKSIEARIEAIKQTMYASSTPKQTKEAAAENNKAYAEHVKAAPEHVQAQNKSFDSLQKFGIANTVKGAEQAYPFSEKFMPQKDIRQIKELNSEIAGTKDPEGIQRLTDVRDSITASHQDQWKQNPQEYSQKNAENYLTNSPSELHSATKNHEEVFRHNPIAYEKAVAPEMERIAAERHSITQQIDKAEHSHNLDQKEGFQTIEHGKNDRHDHSEQYAVIPGRMSEQEHLQQRSAELMQGMRDKQFAHVEKATDNAKTMEMSKSEERGAAETHNLDHDM